MPFSEKISFRGTRKFDSFHHSIGIPSFLPNGKRSEFLSEPFPGKCKNSEFCYEPCRREKQLELCNSTPNHSAEDKNALSSIPKRFVEEKKLRTHSQNALNSIPNHFAE